MSVLVALIRGFFETLLHDPLELLWYLRIELGRTHRWFAQDGGERVEVGRAAEGRLPGDHLIERATEREDIRTMIHRLSPSLFGRHVSSGSQEHAPDREIGRKRLRMALWSLCRPLSLADTL